MIVAPINAGDIVTSWSLDIPVVVVLVVAAAAYLLGVRRAASNGVAWPWWRTVLFLVVGLGTLAWTTCGVLGAYNRTLFWVFGVQMTLLVSIVPVAIVAGDPAGLVRAGRRGPPREGRSLLARVMRVFTYPFVAPVVAMASQMVILFSGYLHAALTHGWVMDLLYLHVLGAGCLIVVPLLGADEVLPTWCTDPMKMLVAGVDGLLDAVPGICALTTGTVLGGGYYQSLHRGWGPSPLWDTHLGGGLMLAVAEVVGIPMLVVLFFRWARNDIQHAEQVDAEIEGGRASAPAPERPVEPPPLERPWWETDPRFRNPRS